MTTSTWHADTALLDAYAEGRLDGVLAASLESHLSTCARCRRALPPTASPAALESAWRAVRDTVEAPARPLFVRLAQRLGLSDRHAVLLTATASLRTAWLAGAFLALAFAALAAAWSGKGTVAPFLLVAPLVPVLGVATAYNPQADPLESLIGAAPFGRTRLVLLRTLAIVLSVLPAATALGFLVPGPRWLAVAWLGPALALIPVVLALGSFIGPRAAAGVVSVAWSGVVLSSLRGVAPTWPVEVDQQVVYLALALLSAAVLVSRARQSRRMGAVL